MNQFAVVCIVHAALKQQHPDTKGIIPHKNLSEAGAVLQPLSGGFH